MYDDDTTTRHDDDTTTTVEKLRGNDGKFPKYAWPGGYSIFYLCDDGEALCPDCMNDKTNPIHFGGDNDGWKIISADINYEDSHLFCAHCNKRIESAYAENEQ